MERQNVYTTDIKGRDIKEIAYNENRKFVFPKLRLTLDFSQVDLKWEHKKSSSNEHGMF